MSRRLVVMALVAGGLTVAPVAAQPAPDAPRILVMPFASDRADGRAFWLAEAAAVLLAEDLRAMGAGAITREERSEAFARLQLPQSAALTDATVIRVGQLVGARHVIMGTLELDGETVVVSARSIALDTARLDAAATARGPLTDLFAVVERLARSMALPPAAPTAPLERAYPPVAAFELYIKGILAETPVYAVNYLQNAIKQAPDFDRARLALWAVYNAMADHERALAIVEPVAVASPWARRARFDAGLSELGLGRYDQAFATFSALAREQTTAAVLNNLGVVELRRDTRSARAAAAYLERAADADSDDPDYRFNTGYAFWRAGDWPAAIHWLREAVRRNPADADAHVVLSAALTADGNAAEAARERELAGRLSSDYETPSGGSAPLAVPDDLERVRGAVELPRQMTIEATLASSDAREQRALAAEYFARARGLFADERDREAAELLNRALFVAPYDADAHLLVGRLHLRNGRPREAVDALRISLWSRETAEAHAVLAEAYFELKDREAAVAEAERALGLDPSLGEARAVLDRAEREP